MKIIYRVFFFNYLKNLSIIMFIGFLSSSSLFGACTQDINFGSYSIYNINNINLTNNITIDQNGIHGLPFNVTSDSSAVSKSYVDSLSSVSNVLFDSIQVFDYNLSSTNNDFTSFCNTSSSNNITTPVFDFSELMTLIKSSSIKNSIKSQNYKIVKHDTQADQNVSVCIAPNFNSYSSNNVNNNILIPCLKINISTNNITYTPLIGKPLYTNIPYLCVNRTF